MEQGFQPGTLVRARGRDWVVQAGSSEGWLRLRPVGGAEDEVTSLIPALEPEPVEPACFPPPDPNRSGLFWSAGLLYDALRFTLRHGAGPFRSFGSLAFEPRSYQFVPLMMAMRLPVVRLLIADDVGIGKTIEAGLIVRELFDRGEIGRFAVLAPPHLVDQWVTELRERFHFLAEALTAGSAARLEKTLPAEKLLSEVYPCLVVSLDFIKSERHRDQFATMPLDLVVVDEAHTCTSVSGRSRQLRFELLKRLSAKPGRHMIFLTATPHSGNEEGFRNLLSLIDPKFGGLGEDPKKYKALRQELAAHFVQRRRKDIAEWRVSAEDRTTGFPVRMTAECTYALSPESDAFLKILRDYCRNMVQGTTFETGRILWYAALSMLRCASSSPAAAVRMLMNRMGLSEEARTEALVDAMEEDLGDSSREEAPDLEPASAGSDESAEARLLAMARALEEAPEKDAKLALLIGHTKKLLDAGFLPVVFCRYVATAHYVAEALRKSFAKEKDLLVECVTGEYVPDERRMRVEAVGEAAKRILVATDCLSEGINLQAHFTAVIHYDLAWNPTRHEQREGRIDRFGQAAREVRTLMLYGSDNPVDGFILRVILQKSRTIRQSLGVTVPVPVEKETIAKALLEAALFQNRPPKQEDLPFGELEAKNEAPEIEAAWTNAIEKMKRTNTIFAQRSIHPEAVYPLWEAQQKVLGSHSDVKTFCRGAAAALGFRFESQGDGTFRLPGAAAIPEALRLRLGDEGLTGGTGGAAIDLEALHRSSPLVNALAESVLEASIQADTKTIARSAVTLTGEVARLTRLYLLRIRFQVELGSRKTLMAEEILPVAASGVKHPEWETGERAAGLVRLPARGNFPSTVVRKRLAEALQFLRENAGTLERIAKERAGALLADHKQAKAFASKGAVLRVAPCLPVDVMGVFVLLPDEED